MMGLSVRMAQGAVLNATPQRLASWRHPGRTTALQVPTSTRWHNDCGMLTVSAPRVCPALATGKCHGGHEITDCMAR